MKQRVWGLPLSSRPVLDFEANGSQLEVRPVEPGGQPRIEMKHGHAPLDVRSVGDKVLVRIAGNAAADFGPGLIEGAVSSLLSARFGGQFTLYLPANVQARIWANMGQARIRGLAGCDLEVSVAAGQVELEDCRGRFVLKAKAGQIVGKRLGGTFTVESGAGEAVLEIVQLDEGVHTVHSTMGAVKIDLTPGLDVRIESRTVMGSTRTRYPSNNSSPRVLKLEAELGAVKVREGAPSEDPRHGDWPDWRKTWLERPVDAGGADPATELRAILELVQQKKISPEEAERLISAL